MNQAAERFEQSRLTGAVRPHQTKDLTLPDSEVDPVKSLKLTLLGFSIGVFETVRHDDRRGAVT
jgi:hypothetical protein